MHRNTTAAREALLTSRSLFNIHATFFEQLLASITPETAPGLHAGLTAAMEALTEQLDVISAGLDTLQDNQIQLDDYARRLEYNYRCRLWWRALAIETGLRRRTLEDLKAVAFREMVEQVPSEAVLRQRLDSLVEELEAVETAEVTNTAESAKPLRSVDLNPPEHFRKGD
jgi:hypothetical protein